MSAIAPINNRPVIKTPQELVHIKHRISLLQYKYWVLMLRAYREAYEEHGTSLGDKDYCYMPMKRLAEHLGYEPKTAEIEHDLESIRKEPIIFNVLEKDGQKGKTGRGFITEWYVSSNRIGVVFPPVIRDAIEKLDGTKSIFHLLNWSIFNSFTGKYEAVLYKLCKDYVGVKKTPYMTLEKFRDYMGIKEGEYTDFKRLSQWVISGPVKRINKKDPKGINSDITIKAEFKREGRKVVGLWFNVAMEQTSMNFGDDPAFRFAKVTVTLSQQEKYIEAKGAEMVELSIQRANVYAEEQEKQGKEVNYGAIYRTAIEEEWGKEYQEKKAKEADKLTAAEKRLAIETREANQKRIEDLQGQYQRSVTTAAVKALAPEALLAQVDAYILEAGQENAKSYNPAKREFTDTVEKSRFTIWLRKRVEPLFDPEAFAAWLQQEKGLNPKTLGL